jgi:hypothetical protein
MRFYTLAYKFYCGVDLHARAMYLCILDHAGTIVLHREVAAEPGAFLDAIAPFRDDLVVACECLFCWYWLADLCQAETIAFVLGMKAIHRSSERNVLTEPTGGALPPFAPVGVESPLAQLRHRGRADTLKRRRKERDDFLGREGKPLQSPSRKGRRQTLNSCLVQLARGVDASLKNESLAPVSRASSSNELKKTGLFRPVPGCALLTFETI